MKKAKKGNKSKSKLTTPPIPAIIPPNSKQKKQTRIPRPLGVTMILREYHKTNNESLLTKARSIIIEQWSSNNYIYQGKVTSIDEIAKLLAVSPLYVTKKIVQPMKNWLMGEKIEDRYGALIGLLTKMGLATRAQIQGHIQVMEAAQINNKTGKMEYTPFVSGEITKALGLIGQNDLTLLKIIQSLAPVKPTTAIQINNEGANESNPHTSSGQYIGINEAVKILDHNKTSNILEDPEKQQKLLEEHLPTELPEINATKQQGVAIDGSTKKIAKRDHTKRREVDGPIYPDIIIP